MQVHSLLDIRNEDTLETTREFFKSILTKNLVDVLLIPLQVPNTEQVSLGLVKDPKQLDQANPFAPIMQTNGATVTAKIQHEENPARMGVVMRPCEMRAIIELAKLGRINLKRLMLIGIDCLGTFEPEAYVQLTHTSATSPTEEMLRWTKQGPIAPYRLRNACQMCEHFFPENVDIAIQLIGMNVHQHLVIEAREDIAAQLDLNPTFANGRGKALSRLATIRHHRREQALAQVSEMLSGLPSILRLIAPCVACGECVEACPYCETNGSITSDKVSSTLLKIINWGRRTTSCVNCGMCESACPRHIPLTAIQAVLSQQMQKEFNYFPGRSIDERLPWVA